MAVKKVKTEEYVVSKETKVATLKMLIQQMVDGIYTSTIQHKVLKSVNNEKGALEVEKALVNQEKMKLAYQNALMEVEKK